MRNFFLFLWRQYFFFLFLILEIISFILIVQNNYYQRSGFVNSTNEFSGGILTVFNNVSQYFSLKGANKNLAEENARLMNESKNSFMKTDSKIFYYNDTLYQQQYEYVSAKIISNSTNKRCNYLTLNKGSKQGITKDMGVMTSTGIVGIVTEVSENFSSVISVLHKDFKLSAKLRNNEQLGTMTWDGVNYRYGELIDIPTHVKPKIGDTVVTSGYSTSFPAGILIGTVTDIKVEKGDNFYTLVILFSTDFNNISYAYVIRNILKDEQDGLENKAQHD
jgi:rod shape-determining protein MreC